MPIPLVELETARTTYKQMSKILPPRFRRRGERKQRLSEEAADVLVLSARRVDLNVRGALKDVFLEPRNPFESQAKRKPRREIALFGGLGLALFAVFIASSWMAR
jgi:hypothetical protein